MKLISKLKDYYDGLRAMDRDEDPVYVRMTRVIPLAGAGDTDEERADRLAAQPLWTAATTINPSYSLPFPRGVIGFCGRLFFFYDVYGQCCWNIEQLNAATAQAIAEGQLLVRPSDVARALENTEREWTLLERRCADDPFIHFRSPVLLRRDNAIVVNPMLRPIGFASQVDAYAA